jgi:CBS domain-containing protein
MKLGHVCQTTVVTTFADTTLADATAEMRRRHVGALVVIEERNGARWPVGIVTDRDIAVALATHCANDATRVGEVMSRNLIVAGDHDDFFDGLSKMRRFGVRRLPIITLDGRLRGIITLDDVIDVLSAKLREAVSVVPRERQVEARAVAAGRTF